MKVNGLGVETLLGRGGRMGDDTNVNVAVLSVGRLGPVARFSLEDRSSQSKCSS